jgi:hypothetical protein
VVCSRVVNLGMRPNLGDGGENESEVTWNGEAWMEQAQVAEVQQ